MSNPNVGEWVPIETRDITGRMRADNGALHVDRLMWAYLSAAQWEAAKATGDRLMAGIRGRKVLALADGTMALFDLSSDVEGCLPEFPGLDGMRDADWAHVARVLRDLDGSFPLLRGLWEQAGRELEAA
jgi:hypothetical protein